jgi:hypothetical protein
VTVAVPREASADGGEPDPRCRGTHSLWDPLPDACLGVIDTDRPHQTDTPHVIPAGHTQVESAVGEVQLGGVLGALPGARSARLVLFDDGYKIRSRFARRSSATRRARHVRARGRPLRAVLASALTYTFVGDFGVFVDIYATGPDVALGTGALWAFTRDMQIDLGTYVGLGGDEPVATPFLGFSARR